VTTCDCVTVSMSAVTVKMMSSETMMMSVVVEMSVVVTGPPAELGKPIFNQTQGGVPRSDPTRSCGLLLQI
jgi:hypothetical protein